MADDQSDTTTEPAPADTPRPTPPAPASTPGAPAGIPPGWDGVFESLDPKVQGMVKGLRLEAGDARKRAETAEQDMARKIAKAAGITLPGDDAEPADIEALTADLAKARGAARDSAVQLAVYQAAGKAGLDADALLDSRAFLAGLADADPDGDGFADTIGAAVQHAGASGKYRTGRAPAASTVDGPTGSGGPVSPTSFASMSMAERAQVARDDPAAYNNLTGR